MDPIPTAITCADGFVLHGHLWPPIGAERGTVIINPATGVLARYYHAYARFLAESGFAVLTYDYRGIGLSRPRRLRGFKAGWREWGERDVEAAIAFARGRDPSGLLAVVGHSIGGVLIGFAARAAAVDRILTVGAQYAYWPDYARRRRLGLFVRWHLVMPMLAWACGYFPGRRLGWLEDLPAGVAYEWGARLGPSLVAAYAADDGAAIRARFAAVRAPILAVGMTDDEYGTEPAIRRALCYFSGSSERCIAMLAPSLLGEASVGHFALFHSRSREGFWPKTVEWLAAGTTPWPESVRMSGSGA